MSEFLQQPFVMAFFSAHQMQFALVAWFVLLTRLVFRRFSRAEFLLLFLFMGLVALELLQLGVTQGGGVFLSNVTHEQREGFPRYFNPMAPLLWGWAAVGLADLWRLPNRRGRVVCRLGIVGCLLYFLFGLVVPHFHAIQKSSDGRDAIVAAQRVASAIKRDYAGPRTRSNFPYSEHEYFTTRRPVVLSDYGAASWFARAQSGGANLGFYPYPEDYIFLKMVSGANRGMKKVNPDDYDYVTRVKGTQDVWWMLFRRKGVPHR